MFVHLAGAAALRASAAVLVATTVATGTVVDPSSDGFAIVFKTANFTQGTCTCQLWGSIDNKTWLDLGANMATVIAGDGLSYIFGADAVPRYLRVVMTPAGGYDGETSVDVRSTAALSNA